MPRVAVQFTALALILGFLVGDPGREPEEVAVQVYSASAPSQLVPLPYPVPYADSPQPISVHIPVVDVAADIRPVGMADAHTMQVPVDIDVVGWFDRSVLPSSRYGHTVLVGHRDGATDPDGVFRKLGDVREGDELSVRDLAGRDIDYVVASVDLLTDDAFARSAQRIFRKHGSHRLILITCGGAYDQAQGGYQANVVVVATRA